MYTCQHGLEDNMFLDIVRQPAMWVCIYVYMLYGCMYTLYVI